MLISHQRATTIFFREVVRISQSLSLLQTESIIVNDILCMQKVSWGKTVLPDTEYQLIVKPVLLPFFQVNKIYS